MLNSIQVARGLAAFVVAYCHLCNALNDVAGRDFLAWPGFLSFGYAGVDLFFVISGFIICFITDRGEFRAPEFFARRAIRILPIYYVFTLLTWIAMAFAGRADFTAWRIFASFAVLPQQEVPIAGVGWSLEHEAIFYALFGLAAATLGRRAVIPLLLGLFLVGVANNALPEPIWDWKVFSLFHLQFLLGVVLYEHRGIFARLDGATMLLAGLAGFPATQYVLDAFFGGVHYGGVGGLWRVVGFGLSSMLLLAGLLRMEERLASKALSPLVRLGDASFVLYLCHPIFISGAAWLLVRAHVGEPLLLPVMVMALVASIVFALGFHKWCERPLLDAMHRWLAGRARYGELEAGRGRT